MRRGRAANAYVGGVSNLHWNNTYKALRVIGRDYNLHYAVWCSGEHQLYDLEVTSKGLYRKKPMLTET